MDEGECVVVGVVSGESEERLASSSDGCCTSAIKLRIALASAGSQPREGCASARAICVYSRRADRAVA